MHNFLAVQVIQAKQDVTRQLPCKRQGPRVEARLVALEMLSDRASKRFEYSTVVLMVSILVHKAGMDFLNVVLS